MHRMRSISKPEVAQRIGHQKMTEFIVEIGGRDRMMREQH